jgi:hypothetical protein
VVAGVHQRTVRARHTRDSILMLERGRTPQREGRGLAPGVEPSRIGLGKQIELSIQFDDRVKQIGTRGLAFIGSLSMSLELKC